MSSSLLQSVTASAILRVDKLVPYIFNFQLSIKKVSRILAIDYGTKRTGVAVSDPLRLIAGGLETVETKGLEAWIADYCRREEVGVIVVGKPMQMNGQPSETWRFVEPLVARLRRDYPDKEITLYDERYTSVLAHRTMLESGIGKMARRNKALVDKISATIILQSYMEMKELRSTKYE